MGTAPNGKASSRTVLLTLNIAKYFTKIRDQREQATSAER